MRRTSAAATVVATVSLSTGALLAGTGSTATAAPDPSVVGAFSAPFEQAGPKCTTNADKSSKCKPAGASVMILPNGKILYWDALEGMEDVRYNAVAEYGSVAQNDVSRVLDLRSGTPTWTVPKYETGGANPNGNGSADYLPVVPHQNDNVNNDGDLFCSDQLFLADGRILDVGGTSYYQEPSIPGTPYGVVELEGLRNTRIYDPAKNAFSQSGAMHFGRWYPSLVTLPDGKVFVAGGVTKLMKPVYPDRPSDSGTNVVETETYDPSTGKWTQNPASANKSLPLFPRLHLLPDGHVYFDSGGQTYNPQGQSYDEATWNMTSSYDPKTQTWTDLGVQNIAGLPLGFRGSGFSQMLTLAPPYTKASFLNAGGVIGVSPGTYLATNTATVNTIDTTGGKDTMSSVSVGNLNTPRWYGTGVTLPTGQVMIVNGADRDEVVGPGSGSPIMSPELYDPATQKWTVLASQSHGRTYHNTAVLLPTGQVLVGGHAPIATGYAYQEPALHNNLGFSSPYRDPSFEIFNPPNLFYGPRPVITSYTPGVARGRSMVVGTTQASSIGSVVLVRNPALTHLVDGDQRVVQLAITSRGPNSVTVSVPANAAVLPSGPYMLFVNGKTAKGLTPSVSRQVMVGDDSSDRSITVVVHPDTKKATTTPAAVHSSTAAVSRSNAGSAAVVPAAARPALAISADRSSLWAKPELLALAGLVTLSGLLVGRSRRLRRR